MSTAVPSAAIATIQPVFTEAERIALAEFLAGYRGLTREAYALDLRQFTSWCRVRSLALFAVRRADIEGFALDLEAKGRARATVTRRLSTIAGFYKYAVEEELLGTSPAAHVRRPRVGLRVPCRGPGPQRGRRLAGRRSRPAGRARADLAARAERAAGLGGCRRGHRAPGPGARPPDPDHNPQGRQGGDHRARAAHCPGDRPGHWRTHRGAGVPGRGRSATGQARRLADRRKTARRAGIGKTVTPHTLRHAFVTAALDAGVPLWDVQEAASHADPRTTMRYDRASGSLDRHATYIVAAYVAGAAR